LFTALPPRRLRLVAAAGFGFMFTRHDIRPDVRSESGQAAIEYALVLPVVVIFLLAIVDFGFAFNFWNNEQELASATARYAVVGRNPGPGATLQASMRSTIASGALKNGGTQNIPNRASICVSFPDGRGVGKRVVVTVATDYHWIPFVPYLPNRTAVHISGTATMRQETTPSTTAVPDGCG
jgi:Flp pilus assembly protein TadG